MVVQSYIFVAPIRYLMQGHLSVRGVAFVIPNGSDGHTHNDAILLRSYCTHYNEKTLLYKATNMIFIWNKTSV